jgi:hypothetical protein
MPQDKWPGPPDARPARKDSHPETILNTARPTSALKNVNGAVFDPFRRRLGSPEN